MVVPAPSPAVRRALTPEPVVLEDVSVNLGSVPAVAHASLELKAGEVLALLGPSGCGKTTLLRAIAGLQELTTGKISVGDTTVSGPGVMVPPERRRVGMVFQEGGLFPHLTVEQNVRFGLREYADAEQRAAEMLRLVDMQHYASRMPGTLSGGQQQRVALARALAPAPSVLLLDEPFSALDAGLRVQIRRDVKRLIASLGITTIVVTHDQEEAFAIGEQIAVMLNGFVEQVGTPAELYERPASPWVAEFVGDGVRLEGYIENGEIATPLGHLPAHRNDGTAVPSGPATAIVRPEQLGLRPGNSAVVVDIEYYGHDVRYDVLMDDGTTAMVRALYAQFGVDDRVEVVFSGASVPVWPHQ
ncbi:MAG: ABC transporter ATP-binding protein [Acidimicrobiales bacterium]|nr:ABC transporter ATP-binding protein [Acidimicrobiales bacterium]